MASETLQTPQSNTLYSQANPVRIISIVCERSVEFEGHLDEKNNLTDVPGVKVIKVPCSGIIQPIMIETALNNGASGVVAMGCRMGDCHYREGNKFLCERLKGERMPKLKPKTDKRRIQAYWLSAVEFDKFKTMVEEFRGALLTLETPVTSAT